MKWLYSFALAVSMACPALADEAGDAVFAERGPWDLGGQELVWQMDAKGPTAGGFTPIANGQVTLTEITENGEPALQLVESSDLATHRIGPHSVESGDPALLFFLERTSRDMARLTGGNPFYIRNRMKDSLFRAGELQQGDRGQIAVFRPFADDPNKDRMGGFESLELTFTLSDPKLPIQSMVAATDGDLPGYRFSMVLQ